MKHSTKKINEEILKSEKAGILKTNDVSDGYHTFGELYDHRIALFIALANTLQHHHDYQIVWKSRKHHDGTMFDGDWFIAGIFAKAGEQISYHLPLKYWDKLECPELLNAPVWDGHTPADVVERLLKLDE